jgi:hypothetical protein
VYLGLDIRAKRQVVCKIHNMQKLRTVHKAADYRVNQEAAILSQLDHVSILDFLYNTITS